LPQNEEEKSLNKGDGGMGLKRVEKSMGESQLIAKRRGIDGVYHRYGMVAIGHEGLK
jgi:hypothetical protein